MNALIQNFISARNVLYDHCDFSEGLIAYPIEDGIFEKYWYIENEVWKRNGTKRESETTFAGNILMADTVDNLKSRDKTKYYDASLVRHHFFKGKSVFRGKDLTLVIGDPCLQGVVWLYVLDNAKEIKEI